MLQSDLSDTDQSRPNGYVWRATNNHEREHCYTVWCVGLLFGLGDVTAQCAVEDRKADEIDWLRTLRYASIGCAVGPSLSMWYKTLDRFGTGNTVPTVAKKILVDQLFASPIVNGSVMIMSRVFSGDEWPQIQKKLEDNYVTVMLNSYLVKLFNFFFYHFIRFGFLLMTARSLISWHDF